MFGMLRKTLIEDMPNGSETHEEAFASMWQYCRGLEMVDVTELRRGKLDTPYAYFHEYVTYVCHLHALIRRLH